MKPYIAKFTRLSVETTCINGTVSLAGQVTTPVSQEHEPNEPRVDFWYDISTWRKSYFVQSQNTTKHKTKFITTLQQHVLA